MNDIRTVLFDWDGCLVDSIPLWVDSFVYAFQKINIVKTRPDIIKIGIYNFDDVKHHGVTDIDQFGTSMYEYFESQASTIRFFPESVPILKTLRKQQVKIGIVTSTGRSTFEKQVHMLGCRDLFDTTICWEDTHNHKPHPEPLYKALAELKMDPHNTAFIGDAHTDMYAGIAAGVKTIRFDHPTNRAFLEESLYKNIKIDATISSLNDIPSHLSR